EIPTRKLYVAPSTRMSQPDDRTRSWSSALFPTKSTTPNRTSAGEQNGDRTEDEPRLPGPAAVVPETSKAPIDSLFVSRSSEGGPNESLGPSSWSFGHYRRFGDEARGSRVPDRTMAR